MCSFFILLKFRSGFCEPFEFECIVLDQKRNREVSEILCMNLPHEMYAMLARDEKHFQARVMGMDQDCA